MLRLDQARALLHARVSPRLYEHSLRVAEYSATLADTWDAPREQALLAGVLHDYCRELPGDELMALADELGVRFGPIERQRPRQLLHAPVAAAVLAAQDLPGECREAIARHTVGGAGMSALAKCLYVADAAEPGRDYDGVEAVRGLAVSSLDAAVGECVRQTLVHLMARRRPIHPATMDLYNESCE